MGRERDRRGRRVLHPHSLREFRRDDGALDKEVALKLVPAGPASEVFQSRFRQERDTLARLDQPNIARVVYRLGFGASRKEARQLVNHGHLMINGRKVKAPGALVKAGDSVEVRQKSRELLPIQGALAAVDGRGTPAWLELDRAACKGTIRSLPTKEHIVLPVNEQMVVELYSR